jgi:hypothetical protein
MYLKWKTLQVPFMYASEKKTSGNSSVFFSLIFIIIPECECRLTQKENCFFFWKLALQFIVLYILLFSGYSWK